MTPGLGRGEARTSPLPVAGAAERCGAQSSRGRGLFVKPPPVAGLCTGGEKPLDSAAFEWSFAEIKRWQQKLHHCIA
jgi:hypothetical protein